MNAARYPRILQIFVSALAILLAGAVHTPAGVIVGTSLDLTGSIYTGPLSTIQFVPVGSPQAVAGNVFWNDTVYSPIATNGAFAAQLQQGFYCASPVNHSVFGPAIRKVLIYDPDSSTNTYAFSVCANLALVLSGYLQTNLPPSGDASGFTNLNPSALAAVIPTNSNEIWISPVGVNGSGNGSKAFPYVATNAFTLDGLMMAGVLPQIGWAGNNIIPPTNSLIPINTTIHLMAGTFHTTNGIIPQTGWDIKGAGMYQTIIMKDPVTNSYVNNGVFAAQTDLYPYCQNVTIEDLTVDMNVQNMTVPVQVYGMAISGAHTTIRRVRFINGGCTVTNGEAGYCEITTYGGNFYGAIFINSVNDVTIDGCVIGQLAPADISAGGFDGFSTFGFGFFGNTSNGTSINLEFPTTLSITNGWMLGAEIKNCRNDAPITNGVPGSIGCPKYFHACGWGTFAQNIKIHDNNFHDIQTQTNASVDATCIYSEGGPYKDVDIYDNYLNNVQNGIFQRNQQGWYKRNIKINHNFIRYTGYQSAGIQLSGYATTPPSNNLQGVVIQNNDVAAYEGTNGLYGLYLSATTNTVVQNNYVNNYGGIDAEVYNTVSILKWFNNWNGYGTNLTQDPGNPFLANAINLDTVSGVINKSLQQYGFIGPNGADYFILKNGNTWIESSQNGVMQINNGNNSQSRIDLEPYGSDWFQGNSTGLSGSDVILMSTNATIGISVPQGNGIGITTNSVTITGILMTSSGSTNTGPASFSSGATNYSGSQAIQSPQFVGGAAGLTGINPANIAAGNAGISIAGNAATAITATNATGTGTAMQTNDSRVVSLNNSANNFSGTFTGNGGGLTNVNKYAANSGLTYYVSPTSLGNDTNSGLNPSQPFYSYWKAASNSVSGDTIHLMDGTNFFNNTTQGWDPINMIFTNNPNLVTNLGSRLMIIPPGVNVQCDNNAWVIVNSWSNLGQYADICPSGNNQIDGLNLYVTNSSTSDIPLGSYHGVDYPPVNYGITNLPNAITNVVFNNMTAWLQGTFVHLENQASATNYLLTFNHCQLHCNCNLVENRSLFNQIIFKDCEIWLENWININPSAVLVNGIPKPIRLVEQASFSTPSFYTTILQNDLIHYSDADMSGSNRTVTLCWCTTGLTNSLTATTSNQVLMANCILDPIAVTNPLSLDISPTFFNSNGTCAIILNNVVRDDFKPISYAPTNAPLYSSGSSIISANGIYANQIFVDPILGSDAIGNGTSSFPFASLIKASTVAVSGQTIVVVQGTIINQGVTNTSGFNIQLNNGVVWSNTAGFFMTITNVSSVTNNIFGQGTILASGSALLLEAANTTNASLSVQCKLFSSPLTPFVDNQTYQGTNFGLSISINASLSISALSFYDVNFGNLENRLSFYLYSQGSITLKDISDTSGSSLVPTSFPLTNNVFEINAPLVTFTGSSAAARFSKNERLILDPGVFMTPITTIATSATNWVVIFRDTSLPAVFPAPAGCVTNGNYILVPPAGNP